jgi:hypothetical protein
MQYLSANNTNKNRSLGELRADSIFPQQLDKNNWLKQFDSIELTSTEQEDPVKQLLRNLSGSAKFDNEFKNFIEYAMNKLGIDFQDMKEIEIGLNGNGQMTVSGLKNESDNKKLAEELNHIVSTISPFGNKVMSGENTTRTQAWIQRMFYMNTDYAMSAADESERNKRAALIQIKDGADKYTKEHGIDLDFSQLYRTEDDKITGYPDELAWYFEANIVMPNNQEQASRFTEKEQVALALRYYANALVDAGYDNIPNVYDVNVVFNFNTSSFNSANT